MPRIAGLPVVRDRLRPAVSGRTRRFYWGLGIRRFGDVIRHRFVDLPGPVLPKTPR
ncbi:hypothetical protein D805_0499 [Bifidobacterium thermophilum RBL67]|uniref:Uncharacterized protein n=1 Tax=Bifidobacterium thermophilum RBL67 TaxID=1254439 RepID=M4RBB8_9BIFI|nr:hypothetical protein D805_0499 [Bifidobacterium thermophilum RBL67]